MVSYGSTHNEPADVEASGTNTEGVSQWTGQVSGLPVAGQNFTLTLTAWVWDVNNTGRLNSTSQSSWAVTGQCVCVCAGVCVCVCVCQGVCDTACACVFWVCVCAVG